MSIRSTAARERRLAEGHARRLVAEGYDVVIEPGSHHLPPELAALRPDILARRGGENRIVEIKLRGAAGSAEQAAALARAVEALPGWTFELVVGEAEAPPPWSAETIAARLAEAEALDRTGHRDAALILIVAAAEAAARRLAAGERTVVQAWMPEALFRQLVHEGLIDRGDLDILEDGRRARNALVHGLSPDVTPEPPRLAEVVERMLKESRSRPRRATSAA